jgi:hypothetical protein
MDDEPLDELGSLESAARWTELTFRVADYVTPGPEVGLRVAASDGPATGNIIEAALDEIVFWEPVCQIHDPAPNAVNDLRLELSGDDVLLRWSRPPIDPGHGETALYRIYRSESASTGFDLLDALLDGSEDLQYADVGAASGPDLLFYEVIASNGAGDADSLP